MKNRLVYSTEHNVSRKGKGDVKPASYNVASGQQIVRVRLEKKGRGGKSVSVISGLNLNDPGLESMLKTFKTRLGSGGAIKDGNIEIQGDHCASLLLMLEERGYKAKRSGG